MLELHAANIVNQLIRYSIIKSFTSKEDLTEWVLSLNETEIQNLVRLNVDPGDIKFDSNLLINRHLLNKPDYTKRVEALISIKNANGYYHLFGKMLSPEFLDSEKFFEDIETLKKATIEE